MSDELLTSLLRDVSRSFYLTMRMLPAPVRRQISLAYLLARTTDTIADAGSAGVTSRLRALAALRGSILGRADAPPALEAFRSSQATPAEQVLLQRCPESLRLLRQLEPDDRRLVGAVLDIIIGGQELDLQRFANATGARIVALRTEAELDDYTYRVAGCVGEFWTRLCAARLWPRAALDNQALERLGARFGKGLQLVNILRDIPRDLRNGRCYVPAPIPGRGGPGSGGPPLGAKPIALSARFRSTPGPGPGPSGRRLGIHPPAAQDPGPPAPGLRLAAVDRRAHLAQAAP